MAFAFVRRAGNSAANRAPDLAVRADWPATDRARADATGAAVLALTDTAGQDAIGAGNVTVGAEVDHFG